MDADAGKAKEDEMNLFSENRLPPSDDVTRQLPHSVGMEKAVLSVLMQYSELWHERGDLSPEWFYLPQNRVLYAEMATLADSGQAFELVGFYQRLLDTGKLESAGGQSYVVDVYGYQPVSNHFQSHLDELRKKYACRMAIRLANEIVAKAYEAPESSELLEVTSLPITELHDLITGSKPAPDTKQVFKDWFESYQAKLEGKKTEMGWETGISEFDDAVKGLHPGMYGVISAPSSGGKSTIASQIMCGLAERGTKCLYVLIEGELDRLTSRCMIQMSGLTKMAISSPLTYAEINGRSKPTLDEEKRIAMAIKKAIKGNMRFDSPKNRKMETIVSTIRRSVRKDGTQVAFIDYVQLIRGERGLSKEQEMMGISNTLQELAKELRIFIVLMSQENADGATKHAAAIQEDSDWTLSIVQNMDKKSPSYKQHLYCVFTKERHNGLPGHKLPLILDRDHVRFVKGEPPEQPKPNRPRNAEF